MSKRILIVDSSKNCTELLELLLKEFSEYKTDIEKDYDKVVSSYNNDKYDYVIFDHSCKISDRMMEYVLTENPTQKCILLSDSINCPVDCESCNENFRFVRLLKPINAKDILYFIDKKKQFLCPNKSVFDSVDTLEKLYLFLNLENNIYFTKKELKKDKIIISSSMGSSLRINEMDKIEDNINKKYFSLNVLQNNNIEIVLL